MKRRELLTLLGGGAMIAWPVDARGQQRAMPVVGTLGNMSAAEYVPFVGALRDGLGDAGYSEGRNVAIVYRWADNHYDRLSGLAAELVGLRVAVLIPFGGTNATLALHAATKEIPIVTAIAANPVKLGLIASLNRPGSNVTGVDLITTEITPKRLQLLEELVPTAAVIGMLINPKNPDAEDQLSDAQRAAVSLDRQIYAVRGGSVPDIDTAFVALAQRKVAALLVGNDSFFNTRHEQIVGLAAHYAIPTMYSYSLFAAAGGLISYAPSLAIAYRQCGRYAGRILKGENAADLPVEQPTTFELAINLKTAKALGLTVPQPLLAGG